MIGARRILPSVIVVATAAAGAASVRAAAAAGPSAPADQRRAEAAERFDHAMALLEQGDNAGALAELQRVNEIAPHPLVLYNLGLVHAAMNHPVEAARALSDVLAAPGMLPADRAALARRTRDAQVRRIARLDVTTNVPAIVDVDGVAVGTTPLAAPIPVAAGSHVVGAVAPGHLPLRRELTVAGEVTETVAFELMPSEARLAHLAIRSALPGADVYVDGQRVGQTPLPASLALAPGRRVVELRRAGYRSASRELTLGDGAAGEIDLDLAEDDGAASRRGRLVLAVSEPDPDVVVDGQPRGAYRAPLALPPGLHQVRVLRAGFLPAERLVTVPEGRETAAEVTLAPTPETRAAHQHRFEVQRRWGWIGALGGAALVAGAGAVVALNRGPLADAQASIDAIRGREPCKSAQMTGMVEECQQMLAAADDRFNSRQTTQNVSLGVLAVGLVAVGVGAVLLLTADDPHRYDRVPRERDRRDQLRLTGWADPTGGGLGLARVF